MLNALQIFLVFISALTVIVADAIIKKISGGSIYLTVKDPWMVIVYVLYFIQVLLAVYIFIYKGELAIYANFYIIFYSILSIIIGILFFKETLSGFQMLGILLAILGGILINKR